MDEPQNMLLRSGPAPMKAGRRTSLSIVLPCYNECGAIQGTIEELELLPDRRLLEIIVVNDGSADGSGAILDQLAASGKFPRLRIVHHARNRGYGAALKTGIRTARSRYIAITDADGTYPNARLPELFERCRHADMVVGSRTGANVVYSKIRRIPKVFLRAWVEFLAGQPVPDMNSGLRVFRRSVALRFFKVLPDSFSFTTTITLSMVCNRFRVEYVPIDYAPRIGKSKIRPIRDTVNFFQLILRTGVYFAPLRILMPIALGLFVLFMGSAAYDALVARNLTDKTVILLLFAMNTAIFALLADMINRRSP